MRKGQTTNNGRIILVAKTREKAKQIYPQKNEPAQAHNDPAFKRRRFSFLVEVTEYFYCPQA